MYPTFTWVFGSLRVDNNYMHSLFIRYSKGTRKNWKFSEISTFARVSRLKFRQESREKVDFSKISGSPYIQKVHWLSLIYLENSQFISQKFTNHWITPFPVHRSFTRQFPRIKIRTTQPGWRTSSTTWSGSSPSFGMTQVSLDVSLATIFPYFTYALSVIMFKKAATHGVTHISCTFDA